jgi:hypothetical protein
MGAPHALGRDTRQSPGWRVARSPLIFFDEVAGNHCSERNLLQTMRIKLVGLCGQMISEAKKYHAYARECLRMAEMSDRSDDREKLIELSRVWMEAALLEERHALEHRPFKPAA